MPDADCALSGVPVIGMVTLTDCELALKRLKDHSDVLSGIELKKNGRLRVGNTEFLIHLDREACGYIHDSGKVCIAVESDHRISRGINTAQEMFQAANELCVEKVMQT